MSQLINWLVPEKYDLKLCPDVRTVLIRKQTGGKLPNICAYPRFWICRFGIRDCGFHHN